MLTIVGLLGTTVVPYNLFLHAAMVAESPNLSIDELRRDTLLAVGLGGVVSLCIIIAAASLQGNVLSNAADLGEALAPLYGSAAPRFMQFGFFAAGLTFGIDGSYGSGLCRSRVFSVVTTELGISFNGLICSFGWGRVHSCWSCALEIIRFAQIANGILLPIIGLLLLFTVNNSRLMLGAKPSTFYNAIFIFIELFFIF